MVEIWELEATNKLTKETFLREVMATLPTSTTVAGQRWSSVSKVAMAPLAHLSALKTRKKFKGKKKAPQLLQLIESEVPQPEDHLHILS